MNTNFFKIIAFLALGYFFVSCSSDDTEEKKSDKKVLKITKVDYEDDSGAASSTVDVTFDDSNKEKTVFISDITNIDEVQRLKKAKLTFTLSDKATAKVGADTLKSATTVLDFSKGAVKEIKVNAEDASSVTYKLSFDTFAADSYMNKADDNNDKYDQLDYAAVKFKYQALGATTWEAEKDVDVSKALDYYIKLSIKDRKAKEIDMDMAFYRKEIQTLGDAAGDKEMFRESLTLKAGVVGVPEDGVWEADDLGLAADKVVRETTFGNVLSGNEAKTVDSINKVMPNLVKLVLFEALGGTAAGPTNIFVKGSNGVYELKSAAAGLITSREILSVTYKMELVKAFDDDSKNPTGVTAKKQAKLWKDASGDYKIKANVPLKITLGVTTKSGANLAAEAIKTAIDGKDIKLYFTLDAKKQ